MIIYVAFFRNHKQHVTALIWLICRLSVNKCCNSLSKFWKQINVLLAQALTLFRPGFFYCLKVWRVFRNPPYDLRNHLSYPNKTLDSYSTTTVRLFRIQKEIFQNLTCDVTVTSLLKQCENSDLCKTQEMIHHSKF